MKKMPAATAKTNKVAPTPSPAAAADERPLESDWMFEAGVDVMALESEVVVAVVARADPVVVPPEAVADALDDVSDESLDEESGESEETDAEAVEVVEIAAAVALGSMIAESNKSRDDITNWPSIACGCDLQAL